MTKEFNIDFKALKACSYAMSTEEARYYLMGVHIFEKSGQIVYEATNGHILIRVTSEIPQDQVYDGLNIILPAFLVKELSKKSILKGFGLADIDFAPCVVDETRINIEMLDGLINFKLIDGTFPETDRVIPKINGVSIENISVDGRYVSAFVKSLNALCKTNAMNMQFTGSGNDSPILIENGMTPNWLAVLMPTRI